MLFFNRTFLKEKLHTSPFIRILPIFALGIILGYLLPTAPLTPFIITLFTLLVVSIFVRRSIIVDYTLPLFILLAGFTLTQTKNHFHIFHISNKKIFTEASIISSVTNNSCNIECNSGLRAKAYFHNYNTHSLEKGDKIKFISKFSKIKNHENSVFNYQKYMKTQYIGYTCSIYKYKVTKHQTLAYKTHNWISNQLYKTGIEKETGDILIAMLLGEKSQLNYETKHNYINAGAIHILAVSGLHTGIIYLLICFVLHTIFRVNKNSKKFLIISLSLLWIYAIITYLPSSICRASLIISFALISKQIKRPFSTYNAIAASAFIILLFDPNSLFTVGFQLSYAAYLSIIYFYPKIRSLFKTNNYFIGKLYDIITLSISAQLGTIPLCALYFGQIATYSILTNVLIAFLIPILMYIAILSILISLIHIDITSYLLNYLVKFINEVTSYFAGISGSVIHIHTNIFQTILLYTIIILAFRMLWFKKRHLVFYTLISILIVINSFTIFS